MRAFQNLVRKEAGVTGISLPWIAEEAVGVVGVDVARLGKGIP